MIGPQNTPPAASRGGYLKLCIMLSVLALNACMPMVKEETTTPPPPEPMVVEPMPEPMVIEPLPPPPPPDKAIPMALQMLELGQGQAALELLSRLQVEYGEHATASWLIQQILEDPINLLGRDHVDYTVQRGDSMAQISRKQLGHELWFYLLARYNDIKVPRNLAVGAVLKIPRQPPALPGFMRTGGEGNKTNLGANELLEQGRHEQALQILQDSLKNNTLDDRGRQLLVRAWSLRLDQLMRRGQLDTAEEELSQLAPATSDDTASKKLIAQLENQLKAQRHYQLGLNALERNHLEAAHFSFTQALKYQQNFPEARVRLRQTDHRMTERDHQQAVQLLEQGKSQEAAALWESILERDPENRTAQEFLRRVRGS